MTGFARPNAARTLDDLLFVVGAWLVVMLILFVGLGSAPLTDLDEGAFSEASREMLVRGDWVSPWLLDNPRFDKPVLIHWLQMMSFQVFGLTSMAARLPSALMGLVWVGGMAGWAYLIASRLLPQTKHRVYGWAVLIGGSCLGVGAMARAATADATLNSFLVLTLLLVWRAMWPQPRGSAGLTLAQEETAESGRLWIRLAAVCLGLGLLTKGPIALLVPAAASLAAALTSGRLRRWIGLVLDPVAWLLVLLIAAPWYLLQYQAQGMAFVEGFFGLHNLGRFTNTMHGFAAGPLYYPAWILVATLPWTLVVITSLLSVVGRGSCGRSLRRGELHMAWTVLIFVLVFFSFSATKLPHYGFYGLSGLVVIMSLTMGTGLGLFWRGWFRRLCLLLVLSLMGLVLGTIGLLLVSPDQAAVLLQKVPDVYYRTVLQEVLVALENQSLVLAAWSCLTLAAFLIGLRFFKTGLLGLVLLWGLTIHGWLVPLVMQSLRGPIVEVGQEIQEQLSQSTLAKPSRIITWRLTAPSLSFAAQRVVLASTPQPGDWVVLHAKDLSSLSRETRCQNFRVQTTRTGLSWVICVPG